MEAPTPPSQPHLPRACRRPLLARWPLQPARIGLEACSALLLCVAVLRSSSSPPLRRAVAGWSSGSTTPSSRPSSGFPHAGLVAAQADLAPREERRPSRHGRRGRRTEGSRAPCNPPPPHRADKTPGEGSIRRAASLLYLGCSSFCRRDCPAPAKIAGE
ncbi:unnamed protein product [Urochloa humidicola]